MAAVGVPLPTSRPPMASNGGDRSRLSLMQARLREQLMVEKESRLLEMAARQEAAREGTIQRVIKSSSSSLSSSLSSLNSSGASQGKVRRMFEERRNNGYNFSPVGRDRSYPLEPVGRNSGPPRGVVKGVIKGRGVSMERPTKQETKMTRSRSQVTLQRNRKEDIKHYGRVVAKPPRPNQAPHYKSTSSLLDSNQNYTNRNSNSSGSYPQEHTPSPVNNRFGYKAGANRTNRNKTTPPRSVSTPPRKSSNPNPRYSPEDETDLSSTQPPPGYDYDRVEEWARGDRRRLSDTRPRSYEGNHDRLTPKQIIRRSSEDSTSNGLLSVSDDQENRPPKHRLTPKPSPSKGPCRALTPSEDRSPSVPPRKPALKPKPANIAKAASSAAPTPTPKQASAPNPNLTPCSVCGRNFAKDRIEKHKSICAKTKEKEKKRKVFDPVKMRNRGTESETYVAKGFHLKETKKKKKKADWRKQHEDFINTVRAAKGIKGYERTPMDTSDYVECPHCGRKFNESAADRHIPKCSSIQSNKPVAKQGRRR